jgi:predicted DNA-binding protein
MARVSPEVKEKLRAIAKNTKRSEGFLAREAIEHFVDTNDWQIALIEGAEVARWLDGKGSEDESPVSGGVS